MSAWSQTSPLRKAVLAVACVGLAWSLRASGVVSMVAERVALGTTPGPADSAVRWSADGLQCPTGTSLRHADAPPGGLASVGCEATVGDRSLRQGPFLELYPDGTTARQGTYARGMQVGRWIRWDPNGKLESTDTLRPGEFSRFIPEPLNLCPAGSTHRRSCGFDYRPRLWSSCTIVTALGKRLLTGPYVTWDQEQGRNGERYVLRDLTTYHDDARHGPHLVFAGPFGHESLVEQEAYENGQLDGESRAFYLDGRPLETRHYAHGRFDGVRIGYAPDGSERWRKTYAQGSEVAATGDLTVANVPCPAPTVPTFSPDARTAFCAERHEHFLTRSGPYVVWDAAGTVVESGSYENDEKKELWIAPPGVTLPPKVSDQVRVAEVELFVGDEPYMPDVTPRAEVKRQPLDVWFRNHESEKYFYPRTNVRGNVLDVYGLPPGNYYMEADVDANPANGQRWPGDLVAALDIPVVEREITQRRAQLIYTLHLTSPWDNDRDVPGWSDPCADAKAVLSGPVRFAWERPAVDGRLPIEYRYRLSRHACEDHRQLQVVSGTTAGTDVSLDVPASLPGEVYQWSVVAWSNGKAIAQLMTFADGGFGWSLRFRVR